MGLQSEALPLLQRQQGQRQRPLPRSPRQPLAGEGEYPD